MKSGVKAAEMATPFGVNAARRVTAIGITAIHE
jgi:hypothetical protein